MMRDNHDLFTAHLKALHEPRIDKIVECRTNYTNQPFWQFYFSDGRHASTLNVNLAQEGYRLKGLDLPVSIERAKNDFGFTLTKISPLGHL